MTLQERSHFWLYDSVGFPVSDGATNFNVSSSITAAFSNVKVSVDTIIRTDQDIILRINNSDGATVSLTQSEGSLSYDTQKTTNLYIANSSGSTANIKLLMMGRGSP